MRPPPFIGRDLELATLVSEAQRPRSTRWLIVGERGIGKTRLMHEAHERLDGVSRLVPLGSPPDLLGQELAPHLSTFDRNTSLIIFDDVDNGALDDAPDVRDLLSRLPQTAVFMTAKTEDLDPTWLEVFKQGSEPALMPLQGLEQPQARKLLAAAGAAEGLDVEGALDAAMGNPRLLLEWVRWKAIPGAGMEPPLPTIATILGPDGRPLGPDAPEYAEAKASARGISDALIEELAHRPGLMFELLPRKFEELVAELYAREGFEVELTRASRDGGVDIYALQRAPFGSFLTIVDCKRNRPDRPIQVGLIEKLYGTVMAKDASVGVIATTSYFTKGAQAFQRDRKHRLGLQDFVSITDMLQRAQAAA